MDKIFKGLNDMQVRAVKAVSGPVLVISGPGSGKTKCLTHRIAYLMKNGIRPENILAVTFTNKAADEMMNRVTHILNKKYDANRYRFFNPGLPLIGTFHSICLRILRREINVLGYGTNFVVADIDDQLSVIRKIMTNLEIDTKRFIPKAILNRISALKTDLVSATSFVPSDFYLRVVSRIFKEYESELKKMNALDFDDLISLTVKIFKEQPEILNKYQNIWKHILVDEYQDTSYNQYKLISLLADKYKNIFCIGDDAQSIYQFRKADIRNILNFQKDYPKAEVIMLEQNYRSTKNIIAAAQEIISNNKNQIQKALWTENDGGEKISIKETLNEKREASFIVSKSLELLKQGYKLKDMAVLYRTHAQSRAIEEALISNGVPYQIVGGVKFYERKEIKDILAYLRLIANPQDSICFERIINIPPRGIGKVALEKILERNESNLINAVDNIIKEKLLPPKQIKSLTSFIKLTKDFDEFAGSKKLTSTIKYIIEKTGYEDYLKSLINRTAFDNFEERVGNLKELLTVATKYDAVTEHREGMEKFLEEISLLQDTDKLENSENRIKLMTVHASKGLEFPIVYVAGLEEGLFPQNRAIVEPQELEEERRLCSVAVTRAKEKLVLTYTRFRNIYGSMEVNIPSRFISEIPQHVTEYHVSEMDDHENKIFY